MSAASSLPSSVSPTTITNLPKEPHQTQSIQFHKREFGNKSVVKRSFQSLWLSKWPWLHYVKDEDKTLCFTGSQAWSGNADAAFVVQDFSNWKDTTVKFSTHEMSNLNATKRLSWRWSLFLPWPFTLENPSQNSKNRKMWQLSVLLESGFEQEISFLPRESLAP